MSIELNAQNYKSVAREFMKAKGLHIRKGFTPVNSTYNVSGKDVRFFVDLNNENLKVAKETKVADKWKLSTLNVFNGPAEVLEERFFGVIEKISKMIK
jgi:hypothetical protein